MVEDHVKRYVKAKLKQGKTRAQIEEVLSVMGLSKGDISDAFIEEKEVIEEKEIEDEFKTSLEKGPETRASLDSKERKAFGTRAPTLAELSKGEPKPEPEDLPIFATTIEAKSDSTTQREKSAAQSAKRAADRMSKPEVEGTGQEIFFEPEPEPFKKPVQQVQPRPIREEPWAERPLVEGTEEGVKPVVKPIIKPVEKTFEMPFERPPEKPTPQAVARPAGDKGMKLGAVIEDFREQTPAGYGALPPTEEFVPERVPRKKSLGMLPFLAFIIIAIVAGTVIVLPNFLEQQNHPIITPPPPGTQSKTITVSCDISAGTLTVSNQASEQITPSSEDLSVLIGGKKYPIDSPTPIPPLGSATYSHSSLGLSLAGGLSGLVYGTNIPPANFTC